MDRESHKEYIRRLRREMDDPIVQRKDKNISNRHHTYYIKNPQGEIQPIPHHQIQNHSPVYIRPSFWSVQTPKEKAFLLKKQINSNIIFKDVLKKAGHPQEEIQYYDQQIKQLREKLNKIIS